MNMSSNPATGLTNFLTKWANDSNLYSQLTTDTISLVNEDTSKTEAEFPTSTFTIISNTTEVTVKILSYDDENHLYAVMWKAKSLSDHKTINPGNGIMIENPTEGQIHKLAESIRQFAEAEIH